MQPATRRGAPGTVAGPSCGLAVGHASPPTIASRPSQLEQVIQKLREQESWISAVPDAPSYRPSVEEWADPLAYIRSIQPEASLAGIALIHSPVAPALSPGQVLADVPGFRFTTRIQALGRQHWTTWTSVRFEEGEREYTLSEFAAEASAADAARYGGMAGPLPPRTAEVRQGWAAAMEQKWDVGRAGRCRRMIDQAQGT